MIFIFILSNIKIYNQKYHNRLTMDFTTGNTYKLIGLSDLNLENLNTVSPSNLHSNKVDQLYANTFMWELIGINLTFVEEITYGGYTYNIFETNSLKDEHNEDYILGNNDKRKVSFIKILNNQNVDYTMFSFKPIFEEV